jgi:hypothetical protein
VRDYAVMLTPDGYVAARIDGAYRLMRCGADEIIAQRFSRFYPEEDARDGKPARFVPLWPRSETC